MRKLSWGLIGGGRDSQIGPAHRLGAVVDGQFEFLAGALDIDPMASRKFGLELGLETNRAYGSWQEMLSLERNRKDRLDLVTIATPNSTHFEIAKAFLEADFNVFCEKPMTMTVREGEILLETSIKYGKICAVNYGYTGYPLVRQMKHMVQSGKLGGIRLVKAEFAHGHHSDASDMNNPRVKWRYDPKQAWEHI